MKVYQIVAGVLAMFFVSIIAMQRNDWQVSILDACCAGNVALVAQLIDGTVDLTKPFTSKATFSIELKKNVGVPFCGEILGKVVASVKASNPLFCAAIAGSGELTKLLVQRGVLPNALVDISISWQEVTPDYGRFFGEGIVSVSSTQTDKQFLNAPLLWAYLYCAHIVNLDPPVVCNITKLLLENGASPASKYVSEYGCLALAINDPSLTNLLLEYKADPNQDGWVNTPPLQKTPLFLVANKEVWAPNPHGSALVLDTLLKAGASFEKYPSSLFSNDGWLHRQLVERKRAELQKNKKVIIDNNN